MKQVIGYICGRFVAIHRFHNLFFGHITSPVYFAILSKKDQFHCEIDLFAGVITVKNGDEK